MKKLEAGELDAKINVAVKAAEDYGLEGKDLEVYKIFLFADPYFFAQGDYKRYLPNPASKNPQDPRQHKNWKYFERCYEMLKVLDNADPRNFVEAVFTKTYDEQFANRKIYPAMLGTEWAVNKYINWVNSPLRHVKTKSAPQLKAEAVLNTKRYITNFCKKNSIPESQFFKYHHPGTYFPEAVLLVNTGVVSKMCCAGLRSFWSMIEGLDNDVVSEYFNLEELQKLRVQLRLDSQTRSYLLEAFGDDVL